MNILICEDNVIVAMHLEMIVEDLGHQSLGVVASAEACRRRCSVERPDLVLVDLDLSDGPTGLDLVERLGERGIPSVIVSGQASTAPPTPGAVAALSKPVDESRLARILSSVGEPAPT